MSAGEAPAPNPTQSPSVLPHRAEAGAARRRGQPGRRPRRPGRRRPFHRLRRRLIVPLLDGAHWLAARLSHRAALRLGAWLGDLVWCFAKGWRRRTQAQLLASGVAPRGRDARLLTREVFRQLGMATLEWLHSLAWPAARLRQQVRLEGLEHFEQAVAGGRGVLLTSGHLGNWELLARVIGVCTARPLAALMTDQEDSRLNEWIVRHRAAGGVQMIPNTRPAVGLLRHLLRGDVVGLLVDQDSRRSAGLFVPFFGRPAYTPSGPAMLSRRTGRAIVPVSIMREAADPTRHVFHFDAALWPDPALDDDADIARLTAAYTAALERRIREAPGQWVWMHERWKHRPDRKISPKRPRAADR